MNFNTNLKYIILSSNINTLKYYDGELQNINFMTQTLYECIGINNDSYMITYSNIIYFYIKKLQLLIIRFISMKIYILNKII